MVDVKVSDNIRFTKAHAFEVRVLDPRKGEMVQELKTLYDAVVIARSVSNMKPFVVARDSKVNGRPVVAVWALDGYGFKRVSEMAARA